MPEENGPNLVIANVKTPPELAKMQSPQLMHWSQ